MSEQWEQENAKPIPEEFYSFNTGKPFERCIDCDKFLLSGEPYMIEKAIRQYPGYTAKDIIFEYAMCVDCAERLKNEMSQESMQNIQQFFMSSIKPENFWNAEGTNSCLITSERKDHLEEYQIYAYCEGSNLAAIQPPFMISGKVLDELAGLLSDETTEELNNFMGKHFGPPPELEDLPIGRKLIFL